MFALLSCYVQSLFLLELFFVSSFLIFSLRLTLIGFLLLVRCVPRHVNPIGFLYLGTFWNVNATTCIMQLHWIFCAIGGSRRYSLVGQGFTQSLTCQLYRNYEVTISKCGNLYSTFHAKAERFQSCINGHKRRLARWSDNINLKHGNCVGLLGWCVYSYKETKSTWSCIDWKKLNKIVNGRKGWFILTFKLKTHL